MDTSPQGNGTIYCTNCGFKLTPEDRFCPECGAARPVEPAVGLPQPSTTPTYSPPPLAPTYPAYSGAASFAAATFAPSGSGSSPLLQFDVAYPERLSRLLIFVKWLLLIPHLIVLQFIAIAVSVVSIIAWFAILFTGRYPHGMWNFVLSYFRWSANVASYLLLQRDEYPPFSGSEPYPVQFEIEYPERLSRWKIFLKWLLILPNVFVFYFVILAAYVVLFLAWWAILFTGHFPRGMFNFITGALRWAHRINVYANLLTDAYPPFRMGP